MRKRGLNGGKARKIEEMSKVEEPGQTSEKTKPVQPEPDRPVQHLYPPPLHTLSLSTRFFLSPLPRLLLRPNPDPEPLPPLSSPLRPFLETEPQFPSTPYSLYPVPSPTVLPQPTVSTKTRKPIHPLPTVFPKTKTTPPPTESTPPTTIAVLHHPQPP